MPDEPTRREATLEAVLAPENLRAAWLAVKANDGAAGVDGRSIRETAEHLKTQWGTIAKKLRAGEYRPGAVRAVDIPKPNGGVRTLGIPNVQDRLIQQAIQQVLTPVFEPEFSEHSHGFRPGRSAHDAVRAARKFVDEGKSWVADIDLQSCFDQVNHDILMRLVAGRVRDKALLGLIGGCLRAPMQQADGSPSARRCGTPQGGPLCQRPPALPFGQRLRPLAISLRSIRRCWRTCISTRWTKNWRSEALPLCDTPTTSPSLPAASGRRSARWKAWWPG
jgi:RNA-directed DNA polymerase